MPGVPWWRPLVLVTLVFPSAVRPAHIDAPSFYAGVLAHMRELREPPFLTYRTTVPGGDGSLIVSRGDDGFAELAVVAGRSSAQSWDVAYRTSDGLASFALGNGTRMLSSLAIFDPTWRGAYVWLHRGIDASVAASSEAAAPKPSGSTPPVLAVVTAINETTYDVSDAGAATCPNGATARKLWLRAKNDPLEHPLAEALVEEASLRFCSMRFHEHRVLPSVTFDLDVVLRFGAVGAYYLIRGGTLEGTVRPYRRPGWFRFATSFEYDAFAFPASLPEQTFTASESPTAPP